MQSLTTRRRDAGKLVDETDADDDADAEFSGDLLGECNRAARDEQNVLSSAPAAVPGRLLRRASEP